MYLSQDLPLFLALLFASVSAIIAGSLLLPRGQIMLSEATSHAVLPGLILGFLFSQNYGWGLLVGAGFSIGLFIFCVSWLRSTHRLGSGVEIAALFPLFFGVGVILLSLSGLENTGAIDIDHILFGSIELIIWFDILSLGDLFRASSWEGVPPQLLTVLISAVLSLVLGVLFYPAINRTLMDPKGFELGNPIMAAAAGVVRTILIALAASACLRTAGAVVAISLFSAPTIGAWAIARRLWQVWILGALLVVVAVLLTFGVSGAFAEIAGAEPRFSGVFALVLVALCLVMHPLTRWLKIERPRP